MEEKMLVEIRDLLVEIRNLLAKEEKPEAIPQAQEEDANAEILEWLNEKNAQVEEVQEETKEEAPEVLFTVLDGVDPTGMEEYLGLPVSELPENVVQMFTRPDYIKKFAPKKFPEDVIDALVRLGV